MGSKKPKKIFKNWKALFKNDYLQGNFIFD